MRLHYILHLPAPHTHYAEVEMHLAYPAPTEPHIDLKMAVWTPGSYFIREYARMVEGMRVESWQAGKCQESLSYRKINKNTWRISLGQARADKIVVRYQVYGFELTVRTNYITEAYAMLQGAPTFLYLAHQTTLPATLQITLPATWQNILTPLPQNSETGHYEIADYHTLVDSPMLLGNFDTFSFDAVGVRHDVGIWGLKGYDQAKLSQDMQKIVTSATAIMGENPCEVYTFMTLFPQKGRGGLEHLYSTALIAPREEYFKPEGYEDYLTLIAHEYFHLWNVKRLCPQPLDNFDYEAENYTTLLWQAEGFTSYYENIIMLKAGLITPESFIKKNLEHLNEVENQYGNRVTPVAESSLDAWIKLYRPHENSANSSISYYTKGAIIAMLLDWEIIKHTEGERNLDDLMRYLYETFYKNAQRGFTEDEILEAVTYISKGDEAYFIDFFNQYIYGTSPIPYTSYFADMGLTLRDDNAQRNLPTLGADFDKNTVKFIKRDSPAFQAGLSVGDQLLSIDGIDFLQAQDWLKRQSVGKVVSLQILRDGFLQTILLTLARDKTLKFSTKALKKSTPTQARNYRKWLERF